MSVESDSLFYKLEILQSKVDEFVGWLTNKYFFFAIYFIYFLYYDESEL